MEFNERNECNEVVFLIAQGSFPESFQKSRTLSSNSLF